MLNKDSNAYHLIYMAIMTTIVAVCLSVLAMSLRPMQERNVKLSSMSDILKAVGMEASNTPNVEEIYTTQIEALLLDHKGNILESDVDPLDIDQKKESKKDSTERRFPLFVYNSDEGKIYIVPVRGFGLWDAIWGYVSLKEDLNTIFGTAFDHKGETPGLGAEIKDNKKWNAQFVGKTIMNETGEFVSIGVLKGNLDNEEHQIHSISGATITSVGVNDMLKKDIKNYLPYFNTLK